MARKGENIRKRRDGRWECRLLVNDDGNKKYKYFYAKTYAEVKQQRDSYIMGANTAIAKAPSVTTAVNIAVSSLTITKLLDEWLGYYRVNLKNSTVTNYRNIIRIHLEPCFGGCKCALLKAETVNKAILEMASEKKLSTKYIHDIISVLKSALRFGEDKYGLANIRDRIIVPKVKRKETEVLTSDEQDRLTRQILSDMNDKFAVGILLSLHTGMRIGEICALKWEDIDLNEGYIRVNKTIYRINNPNGDKPKTIAVSDTPKSEASVRKIPLNSFIYGILSEIKPENGETYFLTDSCIFTEPRRYSYRFKKCIEDADIRDMGFHSLRHTFATNCVKVGCDIKSLSEILGHSSVKITLDRYVHTSMAIKKEQVEKLAKICN